MSDWKTIDLLTPEDQERARKLFADDEKHLLPDYEFSYFGDKLLRRVMPSRQRSTLPAPEQPPKKIKATVAPRPVVPAAAAAPVLAAPQAGEQIVPWAIERLMDCPFNPRKTFAEGPLKAMADTVVASGIIQALVVRPAKAEDVARGFDYEIVAGHRRKRAGQLAGVTTAPIVVRQISDRDALDIMLCENLQREDLTPIEEAEALKSWLGMTEEDGSPRTVAMAAAKHGKTTAHIGNMLRLLRLPKKAREALEAETIGRELGAVIAKMPTAELRQRFTEEVLKGHGDGAMSTREAKEHARRAYTVELRASPFDQEDATLVPIKEKEGERVAGGACIDCPWNTANMGEEADSRNHLCTNPTCYQAKVVANLEVAKQRALSQGMVVIEGERARRFVYHDGTPHHDSGMVKLDQPPTQAEVVGDRKPPTWGAMLAGKSSGEIVTGRTDDGDAIKGKVSAKINVPAVLVIDERGRTHEMVQRKHAIEVAKKNGFGDYFSARSGRGKSAGDDGQQKRDAKEKEKQKLESTAAVMGLEELVSAICKARAETLDAWTGMLELALFHAGSDGEAFICQRRAIDVPKDGQGFSDREKALRKYAATLNMDTLPAFCIELLLAGWVKHRGVAAAGFVKMAEAYSVDVKAIREKAKAELALKSRNPSRKKPKKAEAEPEMVRDQIADAAKKRGLSMIKLISLAEQTTGKAYAAAQGPELIAILLAVRALPLKKKKAAAASA